MANKSPLVAIFPGSFDPVTNGHLDLIRRGSALVDKLIVAILTNTSKQPLFSLDERKSMLAASTSDIKNVEVDSFAGLLVHYAEKRAARAILRGIRSIADYESEMQMAIFNRRLRPHTETIFLTPTEENAFISSSFIKEVIRLGGDVSQFVPPPVVNLLKSRR